MLQATQTVLQETHTVFRAAMRKLRALQVKNAEKQARKRQDRIKHQIERIQAYAEIYHPSVNNALNELLIDKGDGFKAADKYVMGSECSDMLSLLAKYSKIVDDDLRSAEPTHRFSVYAFHLIDNLGQSTDGYLRQIAAKYKVSASSNALLAGALVASRRGGMAALAAAEGIQAKYQAGAHNAEVESVFTSGMKMMKFTVCTSDLEDNYRNFIQIANRFSLLGVGDQKIAGRALFSLIFHANNRRYESPEISSQFVKALGGEFEQNFARFVWSPKEAAAHLKSLIDDTERCRHLALTKDLKSYMRSYYTYEKHLPNKQ